jgi:hypothetical protein
VKTRTLLTLALFSVAALPLGAQWAKLPTDGIPRTADGKIHMTAPTPRKADGKPDFSGIWNPQNLKYLGNLAADLKPGELQIEPWAEALVKERSAGMHGAEESDAKCLPPGIPKINAAPNPFKIVQETKFFVILYETFGIYRQVFLDGREPRKDADPSWLGYSVARWDRDALVVDTTGFNGKTWLDKIGHPTTEMTHVTERFRRIDYGHLETQVTIDDPSAYKKPWSVTERFELLPDTELIESVCENERDVRHMPGK